MDPRLHENSNKENISTFSSFIKFRNRFHFLGDIIVAINPERTFSVPATIQFPAMLTGSLAVESCVSIGIVFQWPLFDAGNIRSNIKVQGDLVVIPCAPSSAAWPAASKSEPSSFRWPGGSAKSAPDWASAHSYQGVAV